jgi:Uma2 family endonuclease
MVAPPKTERETILESLPLITTSEFEKLLSQPEYKNGLFELIHGEIVEKMPTERHGFIVFRLIVLLGIYIERTKRGRGVTEVLHRKADDPYNARQPDISYYQDASREIVEEGAVMHMPDLAIEVQSPSQSRREMREKADYVLRNGGKLVWIIYPKRREVEVCTWTGESLAITTLDDKATLTGGDVLPDFTVSLTDIFPAQTESSTTSD